MARIVWLLLLATLGIWTGLPAQESDSSAACPGCPPRRLGAAIGGMMASNLVVWSFNRFVMDEEWARVSPASWKRNWDLGFEFDPDQFLTNQFLHPYQGSQYFNAGRANGFSFWESTPLVVIGSLQWEYMGETHRPSLNDFFTTSLGGIALGEVTHRLATLVRDNGLSGWPRTWRELAAGVLDPAGFFIRLATGESRRRGPNPAERRPELLHTTGQAGFARIANVGNLDAARTVTFLVLELRHGDSFDQPYARPWDTFVIRTEVRAGARMDLAGVQAQGRLFSTELGRRVGARHLLEVTQDFDYLKNVAFTYGAQSVATSLRSRLGRGGRSEFLTEVTGRLIVLGAINSDYAQSTGREYDYGPGFGVGATAAWRHNERDLLRAAYGVNWLHTVNGSDGDHFAQLARIEARAPLRNGLGIGADALLYIQNSRFKRVPDVRQSHPQVRLYLGWFPE
jgi:hypothetical protein